MKNDYVTFGHYEIKLPVEALENCCHTGDCENTVKDHIERLNITFKSMGITVDKCRETIKDYGVEGVENFDEKTVLLYTVWIASGNYNDEN